MSSCRESERERDLCVVSKQADSTGFEWGQLGHLWRLRGVTGVWGSKFGGMHQKSPPTASQTFHGWMANTVWRLCTPEVLGLRVGLCCPCFLAT